MHTHLRNLLEYLQQACLLQLNPKSARQIKYALNEEKLHSTYIFGDVDDNRGVDCIHRTKRLELLGAHTRNYNSKKEYDTGCSHLNNNYLFCCNREEIKE